MGQSSDPHPAVRYCPYCGQPVGSFFGHRIEGGAVWCDACAECFRVDHVVHSEDISDGSELPSRAVETTGEQ
jgi:hypothetical protein